jgi:dolichol-phosphate mannosyltransferase
MTCALSIVVPCFNEEEGLARLEEKLGAVLPSLARRGPCEVLLVDDGSRDGTLRGLEALAGRWPGARVLRHPERRGVGAAVRTGFAAARGEVVLTMDADCTYDPALFTRLLADMDATGADVVTASPYHPQGRVVGVPAWRILLSRGASLLYAAVLPVKLHTYTALFRAQKRAVVKGIPFCSNGFLGVTEFLVKALRAGHRAAETPAALEKRVFGVSKLRTLSAVRDHLGLLASLFFRKDI